MNSSLARGSSRRRGNLNDAAGSSPSSCPLLRNPCPGPLGVEPARGPPTGRGRDNWRWQIKLGRSRLH